MSDMNARTKTPDLAPLETVDPRRGQPSAASFSGTNFTCPMHPEVRQDHAGNCPKCGMALEAVIPAKGSTVEEMPKLGEMTKRFWIGAGLTIPIYVLAMVHWVPSLSGPQWATSEASCWIR